MAVLGVTLLEEVSLGWALRFHELKLCPVAHSLLLLPSHMDVKFSALSPASCHAFHHDGNGMIL